MTGKIEPGKDSEPMDMAVFTQKLRTLRDALTEGLVERDMAVRLGLLASLAGEHLLMVGPPGTAKSMIARRLHLAFHDSTYFERLLTRFTVPEELFGPLSIKGLEDDRYERLTEAYLPTASIAFLDEVFKANSAILNSLLTLLNEREFDNGAVRRKTPLIAVIGASNEVPEGKELDALFDRFLLRLHIGPVSEEAFPALLGLRGQPTAQVPEELKFHRHDLETLQAAVADVKVTDDIVSLISDLRNWCIAESIEVSDRRWRKVVNLLQVSAATNGRDYVSIWDCWLLQHCVWDKPEAHEKVYEWYKNRVGASAALVPSRLTSIIESWETKLEADRATRSQMRDGEGFPLFKQFKGELTRNARGLVPAKRGAEQLFLAPSGACRASHRYQVDAEIVDSANRGRGYTLAELKSLFVPERRRSMVPFIEWNERHTYISQTSHWMMVDGALEPALEPTRYQREYVEGCVREMDRLWAKVDGYRVRLLAHVDSMEAEICDHLWVMPDFVEPASQNLEKTRVVLTNLLERIWKVRQGFLRLKIADSGDIVEESKHG